MRKPLWGVMLQVMRGWSRTLGIFCGGVVFVFVICAVCCRKRKPRRIPCVKQRNSPINGSAYLGLQNQGSTCYLNSLLQCLFLTPNFTNILFWCNSPPTRKVYPFCGIFCRWCFQPEPGIVHHLQKLFVNLQYGRTAPSTRDITKALGVSDVYQPQDVEEYFRNLVKKINEECEDILPLFLLNMVHCIKCETCGQKTEQSNCIISLPLSIHPSYSSSTDALSVKDALEYFLKVKELNEDNKCYCDTCGCKQDAASLFYFNSLPEILVIILKRYEFHTTGFRKLNIEVSVPCELKIPEGSRTDDKVIQQRYNLFAICHHLGGMRGGHYLSEIKSFEDNQWYNFNDASVYKIKEEPNSSDTRTSETAYLLMYHRKYQQSARLPCFMEKDALNSSIKNLINENCYLETV
ncbi:ubiquitin carboxyl-terminal hydrolase 47-like isoform X2 [Rhinatrema bivittatum]|uniref:ubiquitin carboxyl-terminal hydrolase 47-like isoform X2 n=1 Tax=Rhinatrema bivittatum TaxID=194408 RepID=UPI0011276CCA|nr:ubiquitin carboxyl-terminal hydrolase 47-like isoform X2 [Rhinatrema bivittatum]